MKPPMRNQAHTHVVVPVEREVDQRAKTMVGPPARRRTRAQLRFRSPTAAPETLASAAAAARAPLSFAPVISAVHWLTDDNVHVVIGNVPLSTVPSKGQILDLEALESLDEQLRHYFGEEMFDAEGHFTAVSDFSNLLVLSVTHSIGYQAAVDIEVTDPSGSWCASCGEPISEEILSGALRRQLLELTAAVTTALDKLPEDIEKTRSTARLYSALYALPDDWKSEAVDPRPGDTTT